MKSDYFSYVGNHKALCSKCDFQIEGFGQCYRHKNSQLEVCIHCYNKEPLTNEYVDLYVVCCNEKIYFKNALNLVCKTCGKEFTFKFPPPKPCVHDFELVHLDLNYSEGYLVCCSCEVKLNFKVI